MRKMSQQLLGFYKAAGIMDSLGNVFKSVFNGNRQGSPLTGLSDRIKNTASQVSSELRQQMHQSTPHQQSVLHNASDIYTRLMADARRSSIHNDALSNAQQNARRMMQENTSMQNKYKARVQSIGQNAQQTMQQSAAPRYKR